MINRGNWKLSKQYMKHRKEVDQINERSLRTEKIYIRYLVLWAQETHFSNAGNIRPTLPEYMLTARLSGAESQLSPTHIRKTLAQARKFFQWCRDYKHGFSHIKPIWIQSLKIRRLPDPPPKREAVSFDEIMAIAKASADSVSERRIRAAAVFWYLSGIRISAFVSLPLKAVDIENRTIKQHPNLGVRTKNNKHSTTYLLQIPELLEIVSAWDYEVRKALSDDAFWFAHISAKTGELDSTVTVSGQHRYNLARRNLKNWMNKNSLEYHSPHKFRHGHIHWALSRADNMAQFKAVSENVMHSSSEITDKVYSNLSQDELQENIDNLSSSLQSPNDTDKAIQALQKAIEALKKQQ